MLQNRITWKIWKRHSCSHCAFFYKADLWHLSLGKAKNRSKGNLVWQIRLFLHSILCTWVATKVICIWFHNGEQFLHARDLVIARLLHCCHFPHWRGPHKCGATCHQNSTTTQDFEASQIHFPQLQYENCCHCSFAVLRAYHKRRHCRDGGIPHVRDSRGQPFRR